MGTFKVFGDYSHHLHRIFAVMICLWTGWYLTSQGVEWFDSVFWGLMLALVINMVICFFIGITKELGDKHLKKTFFDKTDVKATMFGGFIATIISGIIGVFI